MAWCGEEVVCTTCVLVGRSLQDIEVEKVDPRCGRYFGQQPCK